MIQWFHDPCIRHITNDLVVNPSGYGWNPANQPGCMKPYENAVSNAINYQPQQVYWIFSQQQCGLKDLNHRLFVEGNISSAKFQRRTKSKNGRLRFGIVGKTIRSYTDNIRIMPWLYVHTYTYIYIYIYTMCIIPGMNPNGAPYFRRFDI